MIPYLAPVIIPTTLIASLWFKIAKLFHNNAQLHNNHGHTKKNQQRVVHDDDHHIQVVKYYEVKNKKKKIKKKVWEISEQKAFLKINYVLRKLAIFENEYFSKIAKKPKIRYKGNSF